MNRTGGWVALVRAVAVCVGVAATAPLAWADNDLPPFPYDVGGATEAEIIEKLRLINPATTLSRTPIAYVFTACDNIMTVRYGTPYPATEVAPGRRLVGCLIHDEGGGRPAIVYGYDDARPELAGQILRHEIGHLLGWPRDHRRD